jgi:prenyltransferase beta subunit
MSLRLEMLQVARLAPKLLGESTDLVKDFVRHQQNPDGGFKNRTGQSDLYYSLFALDALNALEIQNSRFKVQIFEQAGEFLRSFGDGGGLDFVHLCCLARAWAAVTCGDRSALSPATSRLRSARHVPPGQSAGGSTHEIILHRIEAFRAHDGGYHPTPASDFGTAYGAFLALGACQDLQTELPEPLRLVQSLKFLETEDGAWTNERVRSALSSPHAALHAPRLKIGSTNATAAAATVLRNLSMPVNPAVGAWLLAQCHPEGGFLAAPSAPLPDLLSTATALHALAGMQVSFESIRETCLDFIDSLWTNEGAFHGSWADDQLDCEYTYYGLLALGHLSL